MINSCSFSICVRPEIHTNMGSTLGYREKEEKEGEREREVTDPNVFSLHVIPNLNHPHTQAVCASHTQVHQSSGVLLFCVVVL